MDPDNSKNSGDKKRCHPKPQAPGLQFQRARLEHPQQPCTSRLNIPRIPYGPFQPSVSGTVSPQISYGPYQSGVSMPHVSTPQVSRSRNFDGHQSHPSHAVELPSRGRDNLSTGNVAVPMGRRDICKSGARRNDSELNKSYFRSSRPESSQNGKQGFDGKEVNLVANYFPITSYTNWSLYQYKIDFTPQEDRITVKRGLLGAHRKLFGGYLFDGISMFCGKKFDSEKFELSSKRASDEQTLIITITFTSVIQPNDHVNIQVFNILLRSCLRHLGLSLVQRNYYDEKAKINIEKHRLQLWPGYKTTIGMFDNGLLLHAEISTKVMRNETVLDFFHECRRQSHYNSDWMNLFISGVLGSVVLTRYNNQTYSINDINDQSSPKSTFQMKDGTEKTYIDYYKEKWGITILDCNQPMLVSKQKKTLKNSNEETLIYLVPELCFLTGFSDSMRENYLLMKDLSVYTRVDPSERIKRYNNFMNRIQTTEKSMEALKDWNLTLSNDLVKIKGRVLPSEKVYCNTKFYDSGENAEWSRHVRSVPMYTSAKIQSWIVIYPNQNLNDVRQFVNTLRRVGDGMSFKLSQPEFFGLQDGRIGSYLKALEQIINHSNPPFILCVIQSKRGDVYSLIKRKLCVDRAVPSQIVLLKNVQNKYNMSVCTKIAIQINSKLGGAPWMIDIPVKGMMIVGFDVCHDKQKNKSYGALVASINDTHTSYFSCTQPHQSGEEISNYFVSSLSLALHTYKKVNKKLPTRIVIYRDGVGDGQISHVHKIEISSIKEACAAFYPEKEVPLAFIIVKKRISTRFFNTQRGFSNPEPGTIVDTIITNPTMYDFFLVSQNVKIGAVTPTHYNVIVDTLPNWSPNYMQLLTFKLTHMYYNWSGTIRVPSHCLLAHKLSSLAAQTLKTSPNAALSELLYYL